MIDPMCSVKERVSAYGVPWLYPCQAGINRVSSLTDTASIHRRYYLSSIADIYVNSAYYLALSKDISDA